MASTDTLTSSDMENSMRAEVVLFGSAKRASLTRRASYDYVDQLKQRHFSGRFVIDFDTLDQLKERVGQHTGITVSSVFDESGEIIEDVRHLEESTGVGLRKSNGIHFATAVICTNSNLDETKESCFSDAASTVDTLSTSSCSRSSEVDSISSDMEVTMFDDVSNGNFQRTLDFLGSTSSDMEVTMFDDVSDTCHLPFSVIFDDEDQLAKSTNDDVSHDQPQFCGKTSACHPGLFQTTWQGCVQSQCGVQSPTGSRRRMWTANKPSNATKWVAL